MSLEAGWNGAIEANVVVQRWPRAREAHFWTSARTVGQTSLVKNPESPGYGTLPKRFY